MKRKTTKKRTKPAKKISVDLDHSTAVLMGSLVHKGLITVKHDGKLGHGKAKLDMTTNPKDKKVTLRANLLMVPGFPVHS